MNVRVNGIGRTFHMTEPEAADMWDFNTTFTLTEAETTAIDNEITEVVNAPRAIDGSFPIEDKMQKWLAMKLGCSEAATDPDEDEPEDEEEFIDDEEDW
jgi:hypothetical protein